MDYLIGLISNESLKHRFSIMDGVYMVFAALCYRDYGLISYELASMLLVIFIFHFFFCKITADARLRYLFKKVDRFVKFHKMD